MILPDVNVLIYAFRPDTPQHAICRAWLENVVNGDSAFAISSLSLSALVRITTNRRSYRSPSTVEEAFRFSEFLIAQPNCHLLEPGERHWQIFKRLCTERDVRGPDVTDAWYAALAIEWGCEWITLDRGFARFPDLKWSMPSLA
ncbi:MAG: type II toxin-antitoxin system VapC family toxin [Pseudomonadota bacterium]